MFLTKIVFAVFTCISVTNYVFVGGEKEEKEETEEPPQEEEKEPRPPEDNHTFVALIDIVFTNGRRRSCTGTIIHDNVVITAAHCFVDHSIYVQPELTASFVVIGTKKMYDTGYENYLPIERVITHPKYKGWTADLALVYTFAGMTLDKPGNAIPLVGERTMTPVDSNVTVLSWGHCKDEEKTHTRGPRREDTPVLCDTEEDSCDATRGAARMGEPLRYTASYEKESSEKSHHRYLPQNHNSPTKGIPHEELDAKTGLTEGLDDILGPMPKFGEPVSKDHEITRVISHYMPSAEKKEIDTGVWIHTGDLTLRVNPNYYDSNDPGDPTRRKDKLLQSKDVKRISRDGENQHSWRRTMGSKVQITRKRQNKLSVEIFGFVNVQTCKKIVEKAMPAIFGIDPNDVVCYATEEHYITDEDSGAPAIRQGHLVAVTVGGVECEGDHVAIGMKMSCFCPWIAENLPDGGDSMNCCKDCCNGGDKEELRYYKHGKHKNKYLFN